MDHQHGSHAGSTTERPPQEAQRPDVATEKPAGEVLALNRSMAFWPLAGFGGGALIGGLLGAALGRGALPVPGLAPLVANGAGVPTVVMATVVGSIVALAAGVWSLSREPASVPVPAEGKHGSEFLMHVPVYGTAALALAMAGTLWVIGSRGYGAADLSDQSNRVTWHLNNGARVGGAGDEETLSRVLAVAFPLAAGGPRALVSAPDDWRLALALTPLIADPIGAAIVTGPLSSNPTMGTSGIAAEQVPTGDAATVAAAVDKRRTDSTGAPSAEVLVVSSEGDPQWALPAAAYAAREGTPVLFVNRESVPNATEQALARRGARARMYALGPSEVISEAVLERLRTHGSVQRIEAGNWTAAAVRFAEFYDPESSFGWGHTGGRQRRLQAAHSILVSGGSWQDAVAAAHLARRGRSGPLLFVERDRLPAVVDNHLWRQRPIYANTPAEGPFNHVWVVGSFGRIAYPTQAWAAYSQEIEQYMTLGDSAVSGFEALTIAWLVLSAACAAWIAVHSRRRLPMVAPMMRAGWVAFALLLGPLAIWAYILSYHRRRYRLHDGMTMWDRPPFAQAIAATAMMFGFDMLLMVLAVFALGYLGFPLVRAGGPLYWMGTSMFLMMVLMYLIALVLMMLVFHGPMVVHEKRVPYLRALVVGLPVMVATMTVESLGMMPAMWWAQMLYLPAMQMPTPDDLTMWGTLLMAVGVGFLFALPFNAWAINRGWKSGSH